MLFFFKQKTAYEMRISDWSSDVCSSDLQTRATRHRRRLRIRLYLRRQDNPQPQHRVATHLHGQQLSWHRPLVLPVPGQRQPRTCVVDVQRRRESSQATVRTVLPWPGTFALAARRAQEGAREEERRG